MALILVPVSSLAAAGLAFFSGFGLGTLLLPTGHDGWVVGNEPVVVVDFQGMADYAKPAAQAASSQSQKVAVR